MGRPGRAAGSEALRRRIRLAFDDGVPQGGWRLARRPRAFLRGQHSAATRRYLSAGEGMTDKLPRIGVRLGQGLDPHRCIELARVAEANGLASLWFAENPFERGILPAVSGC